MAKTLAELTSTIREINVEKGWRLPDGPLPGQEFGDRIALLHSEVSEALEAFRDHLLEDVTFAWCASPDCPRYGKVATAADCARKADSSYHRTRPGKPEGVGSELADVLIRLIDLCDVFKVKLFDMDMEIDDVTDIDPRLTAWRPVVTFGEHLAWLHHEIGTLWRTALTNAQAAFVLRTLVTVARKFDIDLNAEVERKIAYNRTREFRHGGRAL